MHVRRSFVYVLASLLVLVLAACSQTIAPTAQTDTLSASKFLSRAAAAPAGLVAQDEHVNDNGYASPLFDLSSAPNGDILAADLMQGVMLDGEPASLLMPLMGITSVGPLGRTSAWATTTGMDPEENSGQGVWRVSDDGARLVANLFDFESTDPDGQGVDSNPFDVATVNGNEALVVDSGGNSLSRVNNRGDVELVATFPNHEEASTANIKTLAGCPDAPPEFAFVCTLPDAVPAQPVPTSVAIGPNGDYYVGELVGFPAPTGESRIWRIDEGAVDAECPSDACEIVADSFTSIIDLVFGPDGRLYVVELERSSWAAVELGLPVAFNGAVSACDLGAFDSCETIADGLPMITSVAFDKSGGLWGTVWALVPDLADVVQIP